MSGHTPGPWTQGGIAGPDSDSPTTWIYGPRAKPDHQSGPLVAAAVPLKDAPLICAAHDLLEALKRIDADWDGEPEDMMEARAAINRAEGRTSEGE